MTRRVPALTTALPQPTASITDGPDRWAFLVALASPDEQSGARRPIFQVGSSGTRSLPTPIRLDAIRRLDDCGVVWAFSGVCDRRSDPDNYDSDGYRREVDGIYDTGSRQGRIQVY